MENQSQRNEYQTIRIPAYCIPAGAKLIEAYETENQIIVCGDPPDEPEGLTDAEWNAYYETSHNCDQMGCGSLSHVLYRFPREPRSEAMEIMGKIRAVGDRRLEEYYGVDVDKSLCQPPFFSPDEIEAIIFDLPVPQRI